MGCCNGSEGAESSRGTELQPLVSVRVVPTDDSPSLSPPKRQTSTPTISVSPQLPDESTKLNSSNNVPPVYYVVVGRGPNAAVNLTTLQQSEWGQKRIGAYPVLQIGFENPWAHYMRHGMGQTPFLLSLPGFEDQPSGHAMYDGGLDSREFAGCVENEFARVRKNELTRRKRKKDEEKDLWISGWVAWVEAFADLGNGLDPRIADEKTGDAIYAAIQEWIKKKENIFPPDLAKYRVFVVDPVQEIFRVFYADYVDNCTGAGRPLVGPLKVETAEYKASRTPPWIPAEIWQQKHPGLVTRRMLNGVDAIREEVPWANGERVCVTAGGGVGLNAAEKARNEGCYLDWFARSGLMKDTFQNPRNDTFLRNPLNGARLNPGERKTLGLLLEADLHPVMNLLRYGAGAELLSAAYSSPTVEVTLGAFAGYKEAVHIRDFFELTHAGLNGGGYWDCTVTYLSTHSAKITGGSKIYDRLILPNGQFSDTVGQPKSIAGHLGVLTPILEGSRMIGLQNADGSVRILGAGAQNYPGMGPILPAKDLTNLTPSKEMWNFRLDLPVTAVPDGFILSGLNIALANKFFTADRPNLNVNTMAEAEIEAVLSKGGNPAAKAAAREIVAARKDNNGYAGAKELSLALGTRVTDFTGFDALRFVY